MLAEQEAKPDYGRIKLDSWAISIYEQSLKIQKYK